MSVFRLASSVAGVTVRPASATFNSEAGPPLFNSEAGPPLLFNEPGATDWPTRRCSAICAGDSVTAVLRSTVVLPASRAAT